MKDVIEKYLLSKYESYSVINTMATNKNQRNLKDIFIPLTLKEYKNNGDFNKTLREVVVDGFPDIFAEGNRKNLIVDTAGMGKSTLAKRIFVDLVEKKQYYPLLLELRRLSGDKGIIGGIETMLELPQYGMGVGELEKLFSVGNFVFIFDGFDEVPREEREKLSRDIVDFVQDHGNNIFIMTSRPEDDLQRFPDFDCYKIAPLTQEQSFELLTKHDNGGETSKLLVDILKGNEYKAVYEYLTNPLLVSMLFAAFDFKQTIPLKKHLFYEQVYDAYFEKHDLTKGDSYKHQKESKLDSYDFDRVLRVIGYKSLKRQKVEFTYNQFVETIKTAKEECSNLSFKDVDFKNDLLEAVPLFCNESYYIKWVHKSMMEYFAARFIYMDAKYSQDQLLTAMYMSDKIENYLNLFDIYYDIDYSSFSKNIILPLLKTYVDYYEENYHQVDGISDELVKERTGLLFMRDVYLGYNESSKNAEDDFDFLEKKSFENDLPYTSLISYTIGGSRFCVLNYRKKPQRVLLSLLYQRNPTLFVKCPARRQFQIGSQKKNGIFHIDGVDGYANSENQYKFCNYALLRGINEPSYYLDYNAVKSEIEKIESSLKSKEEVGRLIQGL